MALSDRELQAMLCCPSKLRDLTDSELMDAVCRNYGDALAVLYERHSPSVFRIARNILRDDGEAEETVQRVFLDVYKAAVQFNPQRGAFITWLLQYAYHRSIDRKEHLHANRFYSREEIDDLTAAEVFYGDGRLLTLPPQEVACLVEQVLAAVKPRYRRVVELTYLEGFTAEEIAEKTGETPSAVRHSLYRGLSKLRMILSEKAAATESASNRRTVRTKGILVEYPRPL